MQNENPSRPPAYLPGLDTLRFFAALWVAFSHGARLPMDRLVPALQSLNNAAFNGVAAMMVFFVISGLVIHLPQAETNSMRVLPFLARRMVRILPPLYISMLLGRLAGLDLRTLHIAIYWAVYCEIAYYLIYPALLVGFRKFGIAAVLMAASALAAGCIISNWPVLYWGHLHTVTAAAIGLPCWLLGCLLATRLRFFEPVSRQSLWGWRLAALLLSMALKVPVTHGAIIIGYPASHWIFALFAFFWLRREIAWFRDRPPVKFFEAAGRWSYSIYLIHGFVLVAFARIAAPGLLVLALWAAQFVAILACSYVFYRLVEKPSHSAARRISAFMLRRKSAPA